MRFTNIYKKNLKEFELAKTLEKRFLDLPPATPGS